MLSEPITTDQLGQESAAPLDERDLAIIARVENALADGLALKSWWEQTNATNSYAERFELVRDFNESDSSFGFFDEVHLDQRILPVTGSVEDSLYDQPKQAPGTKVREEFREFLLHYFMRISSYRQPEVYVPAASHPPSEYLSGISWCPAGRESRIGFGFSQHYYKLRDSGLIGKFPSHEESAIVDLREIGKKYEWIVVKVRIFSFNLTFRLLGSEQAQLVVPLLEETYLVLNGDFILNEDDPEPGVLGKYGFGYAFIRNPTEGLFAYGPGQFEAALELINFRVLETGEIWANLVFVVNRPKKFLNVPIQPVDWSFRLADLMSFGLTSALFSPIKGVLERLPLRIDGFDPLLTYVSLANAATGDLAEQLCITKERLEKDSLVQHFMQHYQMLVGSLLTWRRVQTWLDPARIPRNVIRGIGS